MNTETKTQDRQVLISEVLGSRRFSNFFWATVVSIGGIGFLLAGLSSYLKSNILIVTNAAQLQFIPQGIALLFYGVVGTLLALYLWLSILWNIGGGYNEFNKETNTVTIFRQGFPGKNRKISFTSSLTEIQAVKAVIKEGINPQRSLYLKIKQTRDIPLTRVGEPLPISEIENQGAQLARFLEVPLEGL